MKLVLAFVVIFLIGLCITSIRSRNDMTNNIITIILTAVSILVTLLPYFFPQETINIVNHYYGGDSSKNTKIEEIDTKYYLEDAILDIPLNKLLLKDDNFFISLEAVKKVMLTDGITLGEIVLNEDNSKLDFKLFKENTVINPDEIVAEKYLVDYYVDGIEFHKPTSFNSILYKNKPYIQFNDLSILTDKIVSYVSETNSVHISEKEKDYTKKPDFLLTPDNCFSYNGDSWLNTWGVGVKDNIGNTYKYGGIYSLYGGYSITYRPNSEYTTFKGVVALSYNSRGAEKNSIITISFDGVEKQSFNISGGIEPIPFNWDITGVNHIEILRSYSGRSDEIGILDAGFYK